ncbi:MAG: hypothetical protein ACTSUR_04075 [Candidatus Heimdallarchaeaceae archaeon]
MIPLVIFSDIYDIFEDVFLASIVYLWSMFPSFTLIALFNQFNRIKDLRKVNKIRLKKIIPYSILYFSVFIVSLVFCILFLTNPNMDLFLGLVSLFILLLTFFSSFFEQIIIEISFSPKTDIIKKSNLLSIISFGFLVFSSLTLFIPIWNILYYPILSAIILVVIAVITIKLISKNDKKSLELNELSNSEFLKQIKIVRLILFILFTVLISLYLFFLNQRYLIIFFSEYYFYFLSVIVGIYSFLLLLFYGLLFLVTSRKEIK